MQEFKIEIEYSLLGKVQNEIKETSFILGDIVYEDMVYLEILSEIKDEESFNNWIINLTNNHVIINKKEARFIEKIIKDSRSIK
jgi:putative IMPACT (imprinted ancient) family translation regulator